MMMDGTKEIKYLWANELQARNWSSPFRNWKRMGDFVGVQDKYAQFFGSYDGHEDTDYRYYRGFEVNTFKIFRTLCKHATTIMKLKRIRLKFKEEWFKVHIHIQKSKEEWKYFYELCLWNLFHSFVFLKKLFLWNVKKEGGSAGS